MILNIFRYFLVIFNDIWKDNEASQYLVKQFLFFKSQQKRKRRKSKLFFLINKFKFLYGWWKEFKRE